MLLHNSYGVKNEQILNVINDILVLFVFYSENKKPVEYFRIKLLRFNLIQKIIVLNKKSKV